MNSLQSFTLHMKKCSQSKCHYGEDRCGITYGGFVIVIFAFKAVIY